MTGANCFFAKSQVAQLQLLRSCIASQRDNLMSAKVHISNILKNR